MPKKLKVLIDTSPLNSGHAHRGIGTYTKLLLEYLRKESSIEISSSDEVLKSQFKEFDLIHYPFFDLFFNTLPIISKQKRIVTIHDLIPLKFPNHYKPGKKGSLIYQKQKLAIKKVDAIITDSKCSKSDIIQLIGIHPDKIHPIYLAANPDINKVGSKQVEECIEKYELPRKYILYVGDINYNKNIPQLIKSLKYLDNDIKLVLLGKNFVPSSIPEWQWIETQMALSDVADRIVFANEISSIEDLSAIYSGALVYVQPSLYEGFGLPVLEAMQCKTPVVCANNSSLLEIGGASVLYCNPRAEEISKKINEILSWSENKRSSWVKKAYDWSQTFTWKKTAKETIEVYKSMFTKS